MSKTKVPAIGGMGMWDEKQTIRECKNLVRWNAPLAIQFMEHVAGRVCSMGSIVVREYNKSVESINEYLDILERQRYYNKQDVWGPLAPQRLEELFEPLDEFSLYQDATKINENLD
mgnify:CR=1 FL=1|tara:strand:- start:308 stop:655 length:348 start_codon:yes stop_codon:yes gene_type:complete